MISAVYVDNTNLIHRSWFLQCDWWKSGLYYTVINRVRGQCRYILFVVFFALLTERRSICWPSIVAFTDESSWFVSSHDELYQSVCHISNSLIVNSAFVCYVFRIHWKRRWTGWQSFMTFTDESSWCLSSYDELYQSVGHISNSLIVVNCAFVCCVFRIHWSKRDECADLTFTDESSSFVSSHD